MIRPEELRDLGLSEAAIRHRVARGRLHRVAQGVLSFGRPEIDRRGRWMAAVLSCGPTAVLSHWAAGFSGGSWRRLHTGRRISAHWFSCWSAVASAPRRARGQCMRVYQVDNANPDAHRSRGRVGRSASGAGPHRSGAGSTRFCPVAAPPLGLLFLPARRHAVADAAGNTGLPPHRLTAGAAVLAARAQGAIAGARDRDSAQRVHDPFDWPRFGLVVETDGLRLITARPPQQARDRERDQAHTAAASSPAPLHPRAGLWRPGPGWDRPSRAVSPPPRGGRSCLGLTPPPPGA